MHPFEYCTNHALGETWALLYSGMRGQGSGEQSILAYSPQKVVEGGSFDDLPAGEWFGYAGYEMLHELENVPQNEPSPIQLPRQWWFQPATTRSFPRKLESSELDSRFRGSDVKVATLRSNMTTERYLKAVADTISQIHAGAFYQANITRKFYGEFENAPDSFELFKKLCGVSPSPFSAYIKFGDRAILSSSPEGFLQISADGRVVTRPIKGSAAPDDTTLAESRKDRAENLMIVDLMRNDLARSCMAESVRVEALHELHQFSTISQLISTVSGQRRADASVLDVIKGCFPPGSMTGAPKVAAMRWCAKQEQMQRGAYSGALGWLNTATQSADLSVVIRTLIIQGNRFEFQVGGGIVADSEPQKELEETLIKARAICEVLGIGAEQLRSL